MNILINNYSNSIKAFTPKGVLLLSEFDQLSQFKEYQLVIFIIDPEIHNNKISLPPAKSSVLKKSIPHILRSESLTFKEHTHFSYKKLDSSDFAHVSFVNRDWMKKLYRSINEFGLSVKYLIPLESCGKEKKVTIYEHGDFSTVNFSNLWGWTAETDLMNDLVNKGMKQFNCSELIYCSETTNSSFDFDGVNFSDVNKKEESIYFKQFNLKFEAINLLKDSFSPKVDWRTIFKPYKYLIASLGLLLMVFFSTKFLEVYDLKNNSQSLIQSANELYYTNNPTSNEKDLELFLKRNINFSKSIDEINFVEFLFNISGIINSNDKVSLSTVIYDSSKKEFLIEIESLEFDDLEVLKKVFKNQGFSLQEGSSRRVGNTILSEILITS